MSQKENKGRGCKVRTNHHAQGLNETSSIKQVRGVPCGTCLSSGIHYVWSVTELGQVIDHILSIKDGGDPLEWDNLQTMCHRCHNVKSGKESKR